MKKHHKHHHKLNLKLTPEQKAKRKARFKKFLHVMLWLDPLSQPVMLSKLMEDHLEKNKEKHSEGQHAVLTELHQNIAAQAKEAATTAPNTPASPSSLASGNALPTATSVDQLSDQMSENEFGPATGTSAQVMQATGTETYEESAEIKGAFADARKKAVTLPEVEQKATLASIDEMESAFVSKVAAAKAEVTHSDKTDLAQVTAALETINPAKIATTVKSVAIEPVGKPDKVELATGDSASSGIPTWGYVAGGLIVVGLVYYFGFHKKKG